MGIIMVAMLAFGGTFAAFTASTTEKTGSFTTGIIALRADGSVASYDGDIVMPGQKICDKIDVVTANKNNGTGDLINATATAYVVLEFVFSAAGTNLATAGTLQTKDNNVWTRIDDTNLYVWTNADEEAVAVAGGYTIPVVNELTFESGSNWTQDGAKPADMGVSITLTVSAKAVQSLGNEEATLEEIATAAGYSVV